MHILVRVVFVITALLVLAGVPGVASGEHAVMTREEFDRWPELPEYTILNFFPSKGSNCTWYAHGRMMQLGYCKYALDSMRFSAYTWADYAARGAEVTDTPEAASIAYWDSGQYYGSTLGHVGVVERVYEDGSILISDSSNSASPYKTFTLSPGDSRWPTAFIVVPKARERSRLFPPGTIVQTTVSNLNFRLEGVNRYPVLLAKGTTAKIKAHVSNGIYASPPGSFSSYHYWWYAAVEIDGEVRHGWMAETYLEAVGYSDPVPDPEPEPEESADDNPETEPKPDPPLVLGDINGDGLIDVRDVTLTMQFALKVKDPGEEQIKIADINRDGIVDIRDVVLLMQYTLGLIETFDF